MKEYMCQPNCENRRPGCHSNCETHKKYQEEKEALKEARRKEFLKYQPIEKPYLTKANIKKKVR